MAPPRKVFSNYRKPFRFPRHANGPSEGSNQPGVMLREKITLKEIKAGCLNERLTKVIECLSDSISGKVQNDLGEISLHISARFVEKPPTAHEAEDDVEEAADILEGLQNALKNHLEKKERIAKEVPEKLKKLKELKAKMEVTAVVKSEVASEKKAKDKKAKGIKEENNEAAVDLDHGITSSAKKAKKQKRTKSENLDSSNAEAEKLVTPQTPKSNKKKNKRNRNSISESLPSSSITEAINNLSQSSKKKRKSKVLQESSDFLPLSL